MEKIAEQIRSEATRLLETGAVDVVIGFRKGSIPMGSRPWLARTPKEAEELHWDGFCNLNLCNYITKRKGRIAVVAKGCDARSIVGHVKEHQIQRDQLHIIGVPCQGMLDKRKLNRRTGGVEIAETIEENGAVRIRGRGLEESVPREEALQQCCTICAHRNPIVRDTLLGSELPERQIDRYADVKEIEAKPAEGRWQYFQEALSPCIRCYACRNACPHCYCQECFVDFSRPQWVGKSQDPDDVFTFHLFRAFHMAGRCTDCGSCERACPMGIPVRMLTKKLEKEVLERWGYEVGIHPDATPPLAIYEPDDPQDFIK
jgi:formate dehydrogenase (coenzyme F420) beta subunit